MRHMKFCPIPTSANGTTSLDRTGRPVRILRLLLAGKTPARDLMGLATVLPRVEVPPGLAISSKIFLVAGAERERGRDSACAGRMSMQKSRSLWRKRIAEQRAGSRYSEMNPAQ